MPDGLAESALTMALTARDLRELKAPPASQPAPYRIGMVKPVAHMIDLGAGARGLPGTPMEISGGLIRGTDDGGFVWAMTVGSEGASAIRVRLVGMNLPADADLYFFNREGEAYGPYQRRGRNGDGDFWTHSVRGSEGILLLRHFGPSAESDLRSFHMTVAGIGHVVSSIAPAPEALCSYNAPCIQSGGGGAVESKAIAYMEWIQGAWIYSCTGGLLADTDTGTAIPYFLTANHCLSKSSSNLELYWNYTSGCDGPGGPKTVGATIRASGRKGDFSLFELNEAPPSGAVMMGWNNTEIHLNTDQVLHRISHPSGAPQAYSRHEVDPNFGSCTGWPLGERIYSQDVSGATEGGSSGAPVVNAGGEVVGQLSGACGYDLNDVCNADDNRTVDGALAFYWNKVSDFLDPGTSCEPSAEICDDGIDNDCDNQVDCDDGDCSGDPACDIGGCVNPGGERPGAGCTSNADCCSDKCKGRPSGKTCR
jgi:V8-like Glu-specific endopeptidase